jgi:lipoyl-dependent peroxiredoxin
VARLVSSPGADRFDIAARARHFAYHSQASRTLDGGSRMTIKKQGSAVWRGGLKDGKGEISTESGVLNHAPYGFATRFEGQKGTNPEELLGAAHAACFSMALSLILGQAGLNADEISTTAEVSLNQVEGGFAIDAIHLTVKATIPGTDQATFEQHANTAKANCPVSKLFKANITMDAALVS